MEHQESKDRSEWPAVIIGAGAAGLLAAIFAARSRVPALVLETRPQPGAKIRVSGGGRCNVLPSEVSLEDFDTSGSRFTLRNILFSWPLPEVRSFFEQELGVPLKREATGKLFPVSDRSKDVVDALLKECARTGVPLRSGTRVTSLTRESEERYRILTADGTEIRCKFVVLATGGLSLPKTGSDGAGLAFARRLGHTNATTHPALVPLTTNDEHWSHLAGISLPVELRAMGENRLVEKSRREFLVTHRGFSGPAVLDLSRHFTREETQHLTLRAHFGDPSQVNWNEILHQGGRGSVAGSVRAHLPTRLADFLLTRADVDPSTRNGELRRAARERLHDALTDLELSINGNEGYRTAEVTAGGVPLSEIEPRTLESRKAGGLFLCGEILDAVGRLGGYNFLWAWVTGRKVGEAIASKLRGDYF